MSTCISEVVSNERYLLYTGGFNSGFTGPLFNGTGYQWYRNPPVYISFVVTFGMLATAGAHFSEYLNNQG